MWYLTIEYISRKIIQKNCFYLAVLKIEYEKMNTFSKLMQCKNLNTYCVGAYEECSICLFFLIKASIMNYFLPYQ